MAFKYDRGGNELPDTLVESSVESLLRRKNAGLADAALSKNVEYWKQLGREIDELLAAYPMLTDAPLMLEKIKREVGGKISELSPVTETINAAANTTDDEQLERDKLVGKLKETLLDNLRRLSDWIEKIPQGKAEFNMTQAFGYFGLVVKRNHDQYIGELTPDMVAEQATLFEKWLIDNRHEITPEVSRFIERKKGK